MAPSDRARTRAHRAYELAQAGAGMRGAIVAGFVTLLALGLHRTTNATWLVAGMLAISLGTLAWRGGGWRRGAFAGLLAGLPPLVVPAVLFAMSREHCGSCEPVAMWACVTACFGAGSLVGILVGYRAITDRAPRPFAVAAIATAALTGLLGCGTTGLGGAAGVVLGLVAGGVTGWVFARPVASGS